MKKDFYVVFEYSMGFALDQIKVEWSAAGEAEEEEEAGKWVDLVEICKAVEAAVRLLS